MLLLTGLTLLAALLVGLLVRDPPPIEREAGSAGTASFRSLLPLWPMFLLLFVGYAPSAGLSGGWGGPYFADIFGADARGIGRALLMMSAAMIAGNLLSGIVERLAGGARRAAIITTTCSIAALTSLWLMSGQGWWSSTLLLAAAGFFGANYPLMLAHGKSLLTTAQLARGITLMNFSSMSGVGVLQLLSGPVWLMAGGASGGAAAFGALFLFFAVLQTIGLTAFVTRSMKR